MHYFDHWHRLEELMNQCPMKMPAHIHACFLPADYHLHVSEALAPFHHDILPRDEDFLRLLRSLLELMLIAIVGLRWTYSRSDLQNLKSSVAELTR